MKDKVMQRFIDNAKNIEIDMMQDDEKLGLYTVPNIIDDWLEKNSDPEITKQVIVEAGELHLYSERPEKYSERFNNDSSSIGDVNTWGKRVIKITVDEAAKQYYENNKFKSDYPHCPQSFKDGAKWQAENMYNEQEVLKILNSFSIDSKSPAEKDDILVWFEKFKK